MKKIIIALLLVVATFNVNAQTSNSNNKFSIDYFGWNNYSDYAGYVVHVTNFTSEVQTLTFELTQLGIVNTFTIQPFETNAYTINLYVGYQVPYVSNMWIKATMISNTWQSILKIKTP
jgi:hypothetical protein